MAKLSKELQALLPLTDDSDSRVRREAYWSFLNLARTRSDATGILWEVATKGLGDPEADIRASVAGSIGGMSDWATLEDDSVSTIPEEVMDLLIVGTRDESPRVRSKCASAIGSWGSLR